MCEVPVTTVPNDIIKAEAVEYRVVGVPVQVHPQAPPAILWKAECATVHNCREHHVQMITARVDSIIFFADLHPDDMKMFERQVKDVEESIRIMKLKRSGISIP